MLSFMGITLPREVVFAVIIPTMAVPWAYCKLRAILHPMDDTKYCRDDNPKLLKDDEHAIILGKTKPPTDADVSKDCRLQIAPSEENKFKQLQLKFDSFYINDCHINLQIHQAPPSSPENVKEMASLSCTSYTPPVLYAEEGNLVMFKLQREEKAKIDYNFRINVTSTDGPVETGGVSSQLMIGLGVGGGVILLILLLLLLRYLCNKRTRDEESLSSESPRVTYSVQPTAANASQTVDDPNRNKTPLTGYSGRTEPLSPEHRALLANGQTVVETGGAPPGPGTLDGEVAILTRPHMEENTSVQDSAYNSNEENLPERDLSFRAARGDSPPPSYEDAVGLPIQQPENSPRPASHSSLPQDRSDRLTV